MPASTMDPILPALEDRGPPTSCRSVYVHVPFCRDRCTYCSFATILDQPAAHDALVRAVLREYDRFASRAGGPVPTLDRKLATIYLGGGTPGLLRPAALDSLLTTLRTRFEPTAEAEVTLEVNPSNVTPSALATWSDLGITRLSMGIQTFDDAALARLGRLHDGGDALRALETVARSWTGTWSADLLLGWLGQDRHLLHDDLVTLLKLGPPHVSLYALTIEPGTSLYAMSQTNSKVCASTSQMHEMVNSAASALGEAGLDRYEVSNFARAGHRSRHNQIYWRCEDYLGLGPGASSSLHPYRWANVRDLASYLARSEEGTSVRQASERLEPVDRLIEVLAVGLRTSDGLSAGELDRRFTPAWRPAVATAGAALLDAGHLELTVDRLVLGAGEFARADAIVGELARGLQAGVDRELPLGATTAGAGR